jgi:hypothetical protein
VYQLSAIENTNVHHTSVQWWPSQAYRRPQHTRNPKALAGLAEIDDAKKSRANPDLENGQSHGFFFLEELNTAGFHGAQPALQPFQANKDGCNCTSPHCFQRTATPLFCVASLMMR